MRNFWPWLFMAVAFGSVAWSWWAEGIVADLLNTDLDGAEKVKRLVAFFDDCGAAAPLIYTALVVVEVLVAPIPGIMLYAPGGLIFGPLLGGTLALLGNTLGAGLACTLARRIGAARLQRWQRGEKRSPLLDAVNGRSGWWIFWLRLNPLTSSDIISYAAGLAGIPTRRVMTATAFGMAPLCFAQSALSDSIFRRFPFLIYPLLVLCSVYLVAALFLLRRRVASESCVASR